MNQPLLKLITGSNKYANKKIEITKSLKDSNKNLVNLFKKIGINQVNFTGLGNSITTGYSMSDIIKPLLLRNDNLYDLLDSNSINADMYGFSRAQDNNEDRILQWIINNIKQSEINRMNHIDFGNTSISMERSGITDEEVKKYFPLNPKKDKGLRDIIKEKNDDLANIIIYNGCTGSFLDNITRKGRHLNLYGFKKDLIGLESILKTIYLENPHTQIYVCGIPNILHINLVRIINNEIKKICNNYSNATYVEPAPAHLFYNKDGKLVIDIHHNQLEYLNLNNIIISTIVNNYVKNMFCIDMDMALSKTSDFIQYKNQELRDDLDYVTKNIAPVIKKYKNMFDRFEYKIQPVYEEFIKYYKERYPHDYYYIPKVETINIISSIKEDENNKKL